MAMKNKDYYIYNGKKFEKSNIDTFSIFYENTDLMCEDAFVKTEYIEVGSNE